MTRHDIKEMMAEWAKWKVKCPRYAIRWSGITGDSAYKFTCPGWVVIVAPSSWQLFWEDIPEPKIPEISDAEFNVFFAEWARHIQAGSVSGIDPDLDDDNRLA